jgi:hypothetical protein
MHMNSQACHPGQSEATIRDPDISMKFWIPDNSCAVSGMTIMSEQ